MALSLAACGGSDDVAVDLTPFNQADIDAAVNTVTVELTAVNDELTAANIELTSAKGELTTVNVDLEADLDAAIDTIIAIDNTDAASEQEAFDGGVAAAEQAIVDNINTAIGTEFDVDTEADVLITALVESNDDVVFDAGAASRDDEVAALEADLGIANDTITAIDNTDAATEADAFDDGAASRDDEVADLQAQIDNLLAADAALDARTLDADGETFTATDTADYDIIVSGTTADGDDLTATVTGAGTGTLSFTFADGDDTVTLTATDLSSYSAIVISGGTVDLSAVTLADGVDITINSGVVMTAAQFLAADSVTTSGDGTLDIIVSSAAEAAAVVAASAKITGVTAANLTLTNAEGSSATDAEILEQEGLADVAVTIAAASVDPVGSVVAAVDLVEDEQVLVDDANDALADDLLAAQLAEAQATLDLVNNELVVEAIDDADAITFIGEAIADTESDALADVAELYDGPVTSGEVLDAGLGLAITTAVTALDGAIVPALTLVDGRITDSDAILSAYISDQRDENALAIETAETALNDATDALDGTLLITRGEAVTAAQLVLDGKIEVEVAAGNAAIDAAIVAQAIINITDAEAILSADGEFDIDADADPGFAAVQLFVEDEDGVLSLNDQVVTVNADNSDDYDITYDVGEAAVTVTASFIDDLLVAHQASLDAVADTTAALGDLFESEVLFDAAVTAAAEDADLEFVDADAAVDAYTAYQGAGEALALANEVSDALEAAVANYDALIALEDNILDLEAAVVEADTAVVVGADETDLDAAIAAVENLLDDADAPGLNFVYDDGVDASNDYVYAADLAGENIIGGDFLDIIDFGAGYVFTTVAADANVVEDAVGDANVLEVLLQQNSDVDGLPTTVSVWIETSAADGSASTTAEADFTITNADGDLSLADLDLSVDGLIITGLYDTGLIA